MNIESEEELLMRILILGDATVGKTCLMLRFTQNSFNENYIDTIGVDFVIKRIEIDGKKIRLNLWDTAGHERFRTMLSSFLRGYPGVVLVYDATNQETFEKVKDWLDLLESNTDKNLCILLVGNKCDLISKKVVDYASAKEFADSKGILFIETSAKKGINVEQAFMTIASEIKNRMQPQTTSGQPDLNINKPQSKQNTCSCS